MSEREEGGGEGKRAGERRAEIRRWRKVKGKEDGKKREIGRMRRK